MDSPDNYDGHLLFRGIAVAMMGEILVVLFILAAIAANAGAIARFLEP